MLGADAIIGRGRHAPLSVWFGYWTAGGPTWSAPSLMIHADGLVAPTPQASTLSM